MRGAGVLHQLKWIIILVYSWRRVCFSVPLFIPLLMCIDSHWSLRNLVRRLRQDGERKLLDRACLRRNDRREHLDSLFI